MTEFQAKKVYLKDGEGDYIAPVAYSAKYSANGTDLDNIGEFANKDLSNLSEIGEAKFDAKLDKSGDTMTGTLEFDGTNTLIRGTCAIYGQIPFVITGSPFPEANTYALGKIVHDKSTTPKAFAREYYRYSASGNSSFIRQLYNYNLQGEQVSDTMTYTLDNDGSSYFTFPKCETKPTTTSSAASNKVAVVTQNYVSGNSWYRVWSDGFIEQGGFNTSAKNGLTSYQITLLKPFTSTNYNIQLTARHKTENGSTLVVWGEENAVAKTVNNFHIWGNRYGDPGAAGVYWRACGY